MGLLDIALTLHDEETPFHKGLFYKASQVQIKPSDINVKNITIKRPTHVSHEKIDSSTEKSLEEAEHYENHTVPGPFNTIVEPGDSPFFIDSEYFSSKFDQFLPNADTPLHLFTFLKEQLGIEKGSLLLLNPEKEIYFPWAITGYDETTNHRIRIPFELLQSILNEKDAPCFFLSNDDNIDSFKNYFSLREFSILERLLFVPFSIKNNVFGLLIITAAQSFSSESELLNLLKENIETLSNIIYQSRGDHLLSSSVSTLKDKDEAISTVSDLISTLPQNSTGLVLFVFDLHKIINQILNKNEDADFLRVREDVLRILSPMVTENGSIIALDTHRLLIVIPKSRLRRNDLFAHQIASAIKGYFSLPSNAPNPVSHIKAFPEDGTNAEELLTEILN